MLTVEEAAVVLRISRGAAYDLARQYLATGYGLPGRHILPAGVANLQAGGVPDPHNLTLRAYTGSAPPRGG